MKAGRVISLLLVFLAGILAAVILNVGLDYSSSTEFCISCHSMGYSYDSYRQSSHYRNASGIVASCEDCHVPRELFPKLAVKIRSMRDVYHELADPIKTAEQYQARREQMDKRVWEHMRETTSRECIGCHDFEHMQTQLQSEEAREEHAMIPDSDMQCIDCHIGVGHK